jgi:hypothetical protein
VLTRGQRWRRGVVTAVGLSLLLAGTYRGEDDHFPVGPFRMFSRSTDPGGIVTTGELWVTTVDGERFHVVAEGIGLRRAELEGQLGRLQADPSLLGGIGAAWADANPDAPDVAEVSFVERVRDLEGRRIVGEERRVKATWTAP